MRFTVDINDERRRRLVLKVFKFEQVTSRRKSVNDGTPVLTSAYLLVASDDTFDMRFAAPTIFANEKFMTVFR